MNKEVRKILMRGGKVTEDELFFLSKHLPYEFIERTEHGYGCTVFWGFTRFYLKEAQGYCDIYDENNYIGSAISNMRIINGIRKKQKMMFMEFHDLSLQKKFWSYTDLSEYSLNIDYDEKLIDPRHDPEFFEIFNRGFMLSKHDYDVFAKYIKYPDYSGGPDGTEGVIPLGEHEECRIKIIYDIIRDKLPFKVYYRKILYEGDFSYKVDGISRKGFI